MIARLQRGDALAHFQHDACALMAEDGGEDAFGIVARAGELIGMAQAGRLDLDQDLAPFRAFEVHLHDFKRFAGFHGNGGTGSHHGSLLRV